MLRYYSEIMSRVVDVDVDDVIEREVRRSYWREKKQRERYYMRMVPLEDGFGFDGVECRFIDEIILEEQVRILREVLKGLNERQGRAVYLL